MSICKYLSLYYITETHLSSKCELDMHVNMCKKIDTNANSKRSHRGSIQLDEHYNSSSETVKSTSSNQSPMSCDISPRLSRKPSNQSTSLNSSLSQELQMSLNQTIKPIYEFWRNTQVAIRINDNTGDTDSIELLHQYGKLHWRM